MGKDGRGQVLKVARADFEEIPSEDRERNLMILKARGLMTTDEFHIFASQLGVTRGAAEYRYRKFLKSEEIVWELHHKHLLKHGELTEMLKGRHLTYGAGYYRRRKYLAEQYGIPFRKFHLKKPKP